MHNRCYSFIESVDELMVIIAELFSSVVNKNISSPLYLDHPYGPDELQVSSLCCVMCVVCVVCLCLHVSASVYSCTMYSEYTIVCLCVSVYDVVTLNAFTNQCYENTLLNMLIILLCNGYSCKFQRSRNFNHIVYIIKYIIMMVS